jgi:hypothetical protein
MGARTVAESGVGALERRHLVLPGLAKLVERGTRRLLDVAVVVRAKLAEWQTRWIQVPVG